MTHYFQFSTKLNDGGSEAVVEWNGPTVGGLEGRLDVERLEREVNVDGKAGGLEGRVGVSGLWGKGSEVAAAVLRHLAGIQGSRSASWSKDQKKT